MPNDSFPGTGNKYLVDFVEFKVVLSFTSATSLTYVVQNPDGSPGQTETVVIKTENIGPDLFLVTWQEGDTTTVVHVEDYGNKKMITNITNPGNRFEQHHGTFVQLPADGEGPPTYVDDIRPLFRSMDITCMDLKGVKLEDQAWLSTPANAQRVFTALSSGFMPPDGRWPPEKVALFKSWMDGGFH
jgi:hypothetical protein